MKMHAFKRMGFWMVVVVCLQGAGFLGAAALPRSTPEKQGVASKAISELVRVLDKQVEGMHSLMVVRHGHVIAEGWWKPYRAEDNHVLYSLSKSFTSTAVGMAVAEGQLSIDDEVISFFPESVPTNASANLKAMRVRDLLTMSTGHQDEPPVSPDQMGVKSFLAQPVPHLPGTHFKYNTPATFMQSALVQKRTGQKVLDYLRPRLFEPLGIKHPVWDDNYEGISLGGYGLRVRTEDIAKFGQLYLQKGRWAGRQLIPESWVAMATSKQVSNGSHPKSDWNQGYGFQFWRSRHNAYRGDGAFGQYCVVMPDQDVVVAITSGVKDMQAVLNVLWERLIPMCGKGRLSADRRAHEALRAQMALLGVKKPVGKGQWPESLRILGRTYVFGENEGKVESLSVSSLDGGKTIQLTWKADGMTYVFPAGAGEWVRGRSAFPAGRLAQFTSEPVAGTFAWSSDDALEVKVCATETPFHATLRMKWGKDEVSFQWETNVGFGPTRHKECRGQAR